MFRNVSETQTVNGAGPRVAKDSESQPFRPTLKVRLGSKDLDVERIAANWEAENRKAPNVAAAIRFYDAYLSGDLDAMRRICPMLNLAIAAESQRTPARARSPFDSSKDLRSRSTDGSQFLEGKEGEVAQKISALTGMDLDIQRNRKEVNGLAVVLAKKRCAGDLDTWYSRVWLATWPGNKGDRKPNLEDIRKTIGQLDALPPIVAATAPAATNITPVVPPQTVAPTDLVAPVGILATDIDAATQARIDAICKVAKKVLALHHDEVLALAVELGDYGDFTGSEIETWHRRCWKTTWPGNKDNKPPTLQNIRDRVGEVRDLPPEETTLDDYYTSDEYLDAVLERREAEAVARQPKPTFGYAGDAWLATHGQLQIQLNRSTYDTWLRNLELIRVDKLPDVHRFVATAPHGGVKDWVDRHIKASMTKTLNSIYSENPFSPQPPVEIVIELEESS